MAVQQFNHSKFINLIIIWQTRTKIVHWWAFDIAPWTFTSLYMTGKYVFSTQKLIFFCLLFCNKIFHYIKWTFANCGLQQSESICSSPLAISYHYHRFPIALVSFNTELLNCLQLFYSVILVESRDTNKTVIVWAHSHQRNVYKSVEDKLKQYSRGAHVTNLQNHIRHQSKEKKKYY